MIALLAPESPKRGDLIQRITGSGRISEVSRWSGAVTVEWEHETATYGAAEVRERIESGDWWHVPTGDLETVEG